MDRRLPRRARLQRDDLVPLQRVPYKIVQKRREPLSEKLQKTA
jgi:hypothetical protein